MRLHVPAHPDVQPPAVHGVQLRFDPSVSMSEVADTLDLARLAAESLHSPERVQLEARWEVGVADRVVAIDTTTRSGRTLAVVFLGLVKREFGAHAVRVARLSSSGGVNGGTEVPR